MSQTTENATIPYIMDTKEDTNEEKSEMIETLLTKGVAEILPSKAFVEAALRSGKKLTVYAGFDPTAPTLHIGHAIQLRKLRQFQDLGHRVIFLIGDFTARIGDPTDKLVARKQLTEKEIKSNLKTYKKQASKFIRFGGINAASVKHNNDWLGKMEFADILKLASNFTLSQMKKRDMFEKREQWKVWCEYCKFETESPFQFGSTESLENAQLEGNTYTCQNCKKTSPLDKEHLLPPRESIFLNEFMYPMMQGYDSVALDVDGEVGGNDQLFNMLAGRTLLKKLKNKEKFVITTKLLVDSAGAKMGKTTGNMISLLDTPTEMYGKIMSWNDSLIVLGFELCTDYTMVKTKIVADELSRGINPRDMKMRLAFEIVSTCSSEEEALIAENTFISTFQQKEIPVNILEIKSEDTISNIFSQHKIISSNTELKRLADAGAIKHLELEKTISYEETKKIPDKGTYKIGKNRFIKII